MCSSQEEKKLHEFKSAQSWRNTHISLCMLGYSAKYICDCKWLVSNLSLLHYYITKCQTILLYNVYAQWLLLLNSMII